MKQDETIRSQKERQARGPEYDRMEVLIGKFLQRYLLSSDFRAYFA
jgi:hypothetical protein